MYFKWTDPERIVSPMDFVEPPQALLPPLSLEQKESYPFELFFHGSHLKITSHAQLSQLAGILKILQSSCWIWSHRERNTSILPAGPTDFRKQIEGLAALVSLRYHLDPYSPACVFLFCNRKKNCLKALRFDKDGFLLATKKLLPDMVFQWPKSKEEIRDITSQQVRWLLAL